MKTQKTLNSHKNPEKEKQMEESFSLTSDYTTKMQRSKVWYWHTHKAEIQTNDAG